MIVGNYNDSQAAASKRELLNQTCNLKRSPDLTTLGDLTSFEQTANFSRIDQKDKDIVIFCLPYGPGICHCDLLHASRPERGFQNGIWVPGRPCILYMYSKSVNARCGVPAWESTLFSQMQGRVYWSTSTRYKYKQPSRQSAPYLTEDSRT